MVTPKLGAGSYTLSIVGDIRDLCSNVCVYESYPFTMSEINAPAVTAGNDTTVANGAIITLHGAATGGASPYTFHWEPASALVNPNVAQPQTINMGASVNFVLNVTDNAGCHGTSDVLVTVVGGPLGVTATSDPETICAGSPATLNALPSGGSGNYAYSWTTNPPGFTSNLQNPVVYPSLTTTYVVQVSDGFSIISGSVTVNVNPKPQASAGANTSIPYGTNTTLHATASGGSGNYSYYWTSNPPGFSSTAVDPLITNLQITTMFILTVTDINTGCVSAPDEVQVSVTGSPLSCNPVATPGILCKGVPSQLHAMVGGGSGMYTFAWTSMPPGFNSQLADPVVVPGETTIYALTVSDGFNQAVGQVTVQVKPLPLFPQWISDSTACIYEKITLDAGNPGSTYYWSNGATTQSIQVETTGIGFDQQEYKVKVFNEYGCTDSAEARVTFTFSACTGIETILPEGNLSVYPNPGQGNLHLEMEYHGRYIDLEITTILGQILLSDRIVFPGKKREKRDYDLSRIPAGLYLVKLKNDSFSRTVKFINR
jgi:hypothetical protein